MWTSISDKSLSNIEAIHFVIELLRYLNPISKVLSSILKILRYRRFLVIFDIEDNYPISKVVYSISKNPSILKVSISKKPSISGEARFQVSITYTIQTRKWAEAERARRTKKTNNSHCPAVRRRGGDIGRAAPWLHWKGKFRVQVVQVIQVTWFSLHLARAGRV
jgi:hypothetical protein